MRVTRRNAPRHWGGPHVVTDVVLWTYAYFHNNNTVLVDRKKALCWIADKAIRSGRPRPKWRVRGPRSLGDLFNDPEMEFIAEHLWVLENSMSASIAHNMRKLWDCAMTPDFVVLEEDGTQVRVRT